jgi:hypothetical protein
VHATCDVAGSSSFSRATSNPKTLSVDPRNRHTVLRILIDSIRASGNRNIRLDAPYGAPPQFAASEREEKQHACPIADNALAAQKIKKAIHSDGDNSVKTYRLSFLSSSPGTPSGKSLRPVVTTRAGAR